MQCPKCGRAAQGDLCAACGTYLTEETPKYYAEGVAHLSSERQYALAIDLLQEGLRRYPQSAMLWFNGGVLGEIVHNPKEAARCYRKALALRPNVAKYQEALDRLEGKPTAPPLQTPAPADPAAGTMSFSELETQFAELSRELYSSDGELISQTAAASPTPAEPPAVAPASAPPVMPEPEVAPDVFRLDDPADEVFRLDFPADESDDAAPAGVLHLDDPADNGISVESTPSVWTLDVPTEEPMRLDISPAEPMQLDITPVEPMRLDMPTEEPMRLDMPAEEPMRLDLTAGEPLSLALSTSDALSLDTPAEDILQLDSPADTVFRLDDAPSEIVFNQDTPVEEPTPAPVFHVEPTPVEPAQEEETEWRWTLGSEETPNAPDPEAVTTAPAEEADAEDSLDWLHALGEDAPADEVDSDVEPVVEIAADDPATEESLDWLQALGDGDETPDAMPDEPVVVLDEDASAPESVLALTPEEPVEAVVVDDAPVVDPAPELAETIEVVELPVIESVDAIFPEPEPVDFLEPEPELDIAPVTEPVLEAADTLEVDVEPEMEAVVELPEPEVAPVAPEVPDIELPEPEIDLPEPDAVVDEPEIDLAGLDAVPEPDEELDTVLPVAAAAQADPPVPVPHQGRLSRDEPVATAAAGVPWGLLRLITLILSIASFVTGTVFLYLQMQAGMVGLLLVVFPITLVGYFMTNARVADSRKRRRRR